MIRYEKKIYIIIILTMIFFTDKTNANYEEIFYDLNIKSLEGNNIELSKFNFCCAVIKYFKMVVYHEMVLNIYYLMA